MKFDEILGEEKECLGPKKTQLMDKYPLTKMAFKGQSSYRKKPCKPPSSDVSNSPMKSLPLCSSLTSKAKWFSQLFHKAYVFSSSVAYRPGKNGDHCSRLYLENLYAGLSLFTRNRANKSHSKRLVCFYHFPFPFKHKTMKKP